MNSNGMGWNVISFFFLFVLAMGVLLFCDGSGNARLDRRLPGSYLL